MLNGKATIILLTVGLRRKILLGQMRYFPPCSSSRNKIEFELDFSNYTTKSDLKKAICVDAI